MALSASTLKGLILQNMTANGFTITGEHSWAGPLADAIANAVVTHITSAAVVKDEGAECNGDWSIE
ncbi:MAG: hypothetical protein ABIK15_07340 [Pseudomonadota bacterium]